VDPLEPGRRIPVYGPDAEVFDLIQALNEMLERLERERRDAVRRALAARKASGCGRHASCTTRSGSA